jgi:hypothetical protein
MTLATLKGMNFNLGDVANAFKLKAADSVAQGVQRVTDTAESAAKTLSGAASSVGNAAKAAAGKSADSRSSRAAKAGKPAPGIAALVDPLQLWGALTQQFQQIAASAMKDASRNTAVDATRNLAAGLAKEAVKATRGMAAKGAPRKAARKSASGSR